MSSTNGVTTSTLSDEAFRKDFPALKSAILTEWPAVDGDTLSATDGDLEKVVALVSTKTEHTKTLVRKQLAELAVLQSKSEKSSAKQWANTANAALSDSAAKASELFEKLEKRTADLVRELRGTVLVNAKDKVRDNIVVSLLMALGLGLILGLIFGGPRRRD